MKKSRELDDYFSKKVSELGRDYALKYVASVLVQEGSPKIKVSLEKVPKQSPLGGLEGELNKIVIISEAYPLGHSIKAAGAGLNVTARNIRNDLLDLLPSRIIGNNHPTIL